jgi:tetratricopeptide (TPR) repeat protein
MAEKNNPLPSTDSSSNSSRVVLRAEFSSRIRAALETRDWAMLEHWAKQWIQLDPRNSAGFKWLARAALANKQISRAAYAYGRMLDFDSANEEARKFFAQYPSTVSDQPLSVIQHLKTQSASGPQQSISPKAVVSDHIVSQDQRKHLAQLEYELADAYSSYRIFGEASQHYLKSFEWLPSRNSALGAARSLHRQHKGHDAIRFLRQQLFQHPNWVQGRLLLGRILFEIGHRSDAQREWQQVLEYEPANVEAMNFLRNLLSFGPRS